MRNSASIVSEPSSLVSQIALELAGPAKLVRNTGGRSGRLSYRVRMLNFYGWHVSPKPSIVLGV